VKKVNGHELKLTNLSKIYWPDEQISKRDMINYYYQIAPFILPYLKDRPQSLNRYPNGIKGKSFYQKDVTGKVPDWIKTYLYHSEGDDTDKHFLLGDDEATLLYMAGMGCIELHPWNSTTKKPDHPTWCIIDLDPDKNSFEEVILAAQTTKMVLDEMGVPCYCKTSGSTGLHVYIPMGNKYTYEQSKEFARIIVTLVHNELPEFTTLERTISDRKGKMYLDFLQNRPHATIAAPYSLRPKPGATVSMPLHWEEVKEGLQMKDFTIYNAVARANEVGDIFKPVLGKGIDLISVIKKQQLKL
jgi:bifunctional non-homologous end joining protein LigD